MTLFFSEPQPQEWLAAGLLVSAFVCLIVVYGCDYLIAAFI